MRKKHLIVTLALATTLAVSGTSFAAEHVEVGKLDCDVSAGVGLIVTEKQDVSCVFAPTAGGTAEKYTGNINEIGIDLGSTTKAKMAWLVYAPASREKGALAGTYTGVSADAAVGIGLGANVLVGGQHGTVSLQPLSLKTEEGLNVAVGISALTLRDAK
jgi:hypothetical protein